MASSASRPLAASVTAYPSASSAVRSIRRMLLSSSVMRIDAGFMLLLDSCGLDRQVGTLQRETETASLTLGALHRDLASMRFDDFLGNRQPKPRARWLIRARYPEKSVEDARQSFGGNSNSRVLDHKTHRAALRFGVHAHMPTGGRKLHRIGQ